MTKDEKRLWATRKKAERLGVFDEIKQIRKSLRKSK